MQLWCHLYIPCTHSACTCTCMSCFTVHGYTYVYIFTLIVHVYSARCNIIRTYVYVLQYMYTQGRPTGVVEIPFCWTLTLVKMIAGAGILACPPRNSDHRKPPTKGSRLKTSTSTDSFEWLSWQSAGNVCGVHYKIDKWTITQYTVYCTVAPVCVNHHWWRLP